MALQEGCLYRTGHHWGIWTYRGFVTRRDGIVKVLTWEEFADGFDIDTTYYEPVGVRRVTAKKAIDMIGSREQIPFYLWYLIPQPSSQSMSTYDATFWIGLGIVTAGCLVAFYACVHKKLRPFLPLNF